MEFFIPLLLLVPLLLIVSRSRKQQRAFVELQQQIAPGQRVMTTAGLHGTITSVDDAVLTLQIAEGVQVQWAKNAVAQIIDDPNAPDLVDPDLSEQQAGEQPDALADPSTRRD